MVFSCSLQETLGIGCYEGALLDSIPLVPDRLSYTEMYAEIWKYPSEWTESFEAYEIHRPELCGKIIQYMDNYSKFIPKVKQQTFDLTVFILGSINRK